MKIVLYRDNIRAIQVTSTNQTSWCLYTDLFIYGILHLKRKAEIDFSDTMPHIDQIHSPHGLTKRDIYCNMRSQSQEQELNNILLSHYLCHLEQYI